MTTTIVAAWAALMLLPVAASAQAPKLQQPLNEVERRGGGLIAQQAQPQQAQPQQAQPQQAQPQQAQPQQPQAQTPVIWERMPRMQLEAIYAGPMKDTTIQRWRDPDLNVVCYLYVPFTAQHSPPTATGYVQYGSNTIGAVSCLPVLPARPPAVASAPAKPPRPAPSRAARDQATKGKVSDDPTLVERSPKTPAN